MRFGRGAMVLGVCLSLFGGCSDDVDPDDDGDGGNGGAIEGAGGSGGVSNESGGGGAGGGGVSNAATEEDIAVLKALAAITKAVQTNENAWPDYNYMEMPIVAVHPGERALIVKHPSPPDGLPPLEGVPDEITEVLGTTYVGVGYEDLLQPGEPFEYFTDIGDRTSVFTFGYPFSDIIEQPLPPAVEEMITAFMVVHEMFHMYQLDHWSEVTLPLLCEFPLDDDDQLALARVEHLALNQALTADDPTAAMEDFLTARLIRSGATPIVRDVEDHYEASEGLAHFTEGLYSETAGYVPDASAQWAEELVEPFDVQRLGRDRHYATGAALAAVLDRMEVPFREQIVNQGRLSELAAIALAIDEAAAQARLPELLERYDVENAIKPEVIQAKEEYLQARDGAVSDVEEGSAPLVVFDFLLAGAFESYGWYTLADCTTYFVNASFYVTDATLEAMIEGKTIRASADNLEHAFRSTSQGAFTLDGASQDWAPGTYPFESLSIAFDDWSVTTSVPGTLTISDNEVRITLDEP